MFEKTMLIVSLIQLLLCFACASYGVIRRRTPAAICFLLAYVSVLIVMALTTVLPQTMTLMNGEVIRKPMYYVARILGQMQSAFIIVGLVLYAREQKGV
jgi:hypothetical protein